MGSFYLFCAIKMVQGEWNIMGPLTIATTTPTFFNRYQHRIKNHGNISVTLRKALLGNAEFLGQAIVSIEKVQVAEKSVQFGHFYHLSKKQKQGSVIRIVGKI